jgi:hypothetical protein
MKKVLVVMMFAFFASSVMAQSNEAEMFISVFKVEKKALLMDYLQLNETEAATFWPIYEEYEAKRGDIAKKRIELITRYAEQYEGLTSEQADALVADTFKFRASKEKLEKEYYTKIKKAVGSIRAAQFLQFERYVDTSIDAELYENMPLVGEM